MNPTTQLTSDPQAQAKVCEVIAKHRRFLIVGHLRPDGDCLGSELSLALGLRALDKEVRVVSSGPILPHFHSLPRMDILENQIDPNFHPEVTIFTDCARDDRTGFDFEPEGLTVNIDHHVSNTRFGEVNWVDAQAAAVGEQIFALLTALEVDMRGDIGNLIFLAIMTDTGSFKYANTTERTLQIASNLVSLGVSPSEIASLYYDSTTAGSALLRGQVLSNMHFESEGRLCWAEITQEMYKSVGGEEHEPEGLVGEMRSIAGVEISILIHEIESGGARAGLRSRGNWDVNIIAQELGGGGHPNASGCFIPGDYEEIKTRILTTAMRHLDQPATRQAVG